MQNFFLDTTQDFSYSTVYIIRSGPVCATVAAGFITTGATKSLMKFYQ